MQIQTATATGQCNWNMLCICSYTKHTKPCSCCWLSPRSGLVVETCKSVDLQTNHGCFTSVRNVQTVCMVRRNVVQVPDRPVLTVLVKMLHTQCKVLERIAHACSSVRDGALCDADREPTAQPRLRFSFRIMATRNDRMIGVSLDDEAWMCKPRPQPKQGCFHDLELRRSFEAASTTEVRGCIVGTRRCTSAKEKPKSAHHQRFHFFKVQLLIAKIAHVDTCLSPGRHRGKTNGPMHSPLTVASTFQIVPEESKTRLTPLVSMLSVLDSRCHR